MEYFYEILIQELSSPRTPSTTEQQYPCSQSIVRAWKKSPQLSDGLHLPSLLSNWHSPALQHAKKGPRNASLAKSSLKETCAYELIRNCYGIASSLLISTVLTYDRCRIWLYRAWHSSAACMCDKVTPRHRIVIRWLFLTLRSVFTVSH